MAQDLGAVKRKIRSLLALAAPGSGATEPERATARSMADRMMAAYRWTEADIPQREIEKRPPPPPQVFVFIINVGGLGGLNFNDSTASTTTGGFGYGY